MFLDPVRRIQILLVLVERNRSKNSFTQKLASVLESVSFLTDRAYLNFNAFVLERTFIGHYVVLGESFSHRIYN